MKTQEEKLREINDVLVALIRDTDKTNNEIIKKEKFSMPEFYCAVKKLQFLKRVDPKYNRRVISNTPVTLEEYQSASDPYGKRDRAIARKKKREVLTPAKKGTVSKKKVKRAVESLYVDNLSGVGKMFLPIGEGKAHGVLTAPIDLPIQSNASEPEISISGSAEGVARFLKLLNDGILK